MKKYLLIGILLYALQVSGQNIGINATGATPDNSAMLDVASNNKGLLIPRISLVSVTDAVSVSNPATSLLVWNSNPAMTGGAGVGFYYNAGTPLSPQWKKLVHQDQLVANTGWLLTGNSGTDTSVNFIGTIDDKPLIFKVYNENWGSLDPSFRNTFWGYKAGNSIVSGGNNNAMGSEALEKNTTGENNVAIGNKALQYNILGNKNTAIGQNALLNSNGNNNIGVGEATLFMNTGNDNIALGSTSLNFNSTGNSNIAIGISSLLGNLTGRSNVAIGRQALSQNQHGSNLIAIGDSALFNQNGGNGGNLAIGNKSLFANTTGSNNTAVGQAALHSNLIGNRNFAFGDSTLYSNESGSFNVAIGYKSLYSNRTGWENTAIGYQALQNNVTGWDNTAIGAFALQNAVSGNNVAIGYHTLTSTQGGNNVAIGSLSLHDNLLGNGNVGIGLRSLQFNTSGSSNISIGYYTMNSNTTGNMNVAIGNVALSLNQSGSKMVAMGDSALYYQNGGSGENIAVGNKALFASTSGTHNSALGSETLNSNVSGEGLVAVGYKAGYISTGNRNTLLGAEADVTISNLSYATAIGANAKVDCSNCMVLGGNIATNRTKVGINNSHPTYSLDINQIGNFGIGLRNGANFWEFYTGSPNLNLYANGLYRGAFDAVTGIYTPVSDKRLKSDIHRLESVLNKVLLLEPSRYEFVQNNPTHQKSLGFIAQDVMMYFPELVFKNSLEDKEGELKEIYTMDYSGMSVVAIKAIQEQQAIIERQSSELDILKEKVDRLEKLLSTK